MYLAPPKLAEANVIFLESPAGVGFSYSNTSSDYDRMGDPMAAKDAYVFLISWLDRFPEYKARPLYITGESYAGHYIPQLAATILAHNSNSNTINLKGIMVGNPYLDRMKNLIGHYEYLWSHGAISDKVWADIAGGCSINDSSISARCYHAITQCQDGILDHDNIYAPTCIIDANGSYYSSTYVRNQKK